nr:integrase, catalytic region, zinc finger, CCHC-type, peptidase aspartic, catalytic [Tanacetum cinerariifolium]
MITNGPRRPKAKVDYPSPPWPAPLTVHDKSASKKNKKRKEWKPTRKVFNFVGYKWKPTRRTFTLVRNACPLTRIIATNKVPLRVLIPLEVVAPEYVVTRLYTRRPKVPKSIPNSKPKVAKSMTANKMEPNTSRGSDTSVAPSSFSFIDYSNDQVVKIMGYGDYQIGNVIISRVYNVEGLGQNLFSVGQFCDSDLEVAFRKHTCFIHNLEDVVTRFLPKCMEDFVLYTLYPYNSFYSSTPSVLTETS